MHTEVLDSRIQPSPMIKPTEHTLVCLLGGFRFLWHGQSLDLFGTGKATALLSEIALRLDYGAQREELIETLWPEQDVAQANASLNSLVYSLQRRLRGAFQHVPVLVYTNGRYLFNKEAGVSTDIALFDTYVGRGTHLAADREDAAARFFEFAVDLYQGDLCAGSTVYAVIERERLRGSFLRVLAWLASRAYREGDTEAALRLAQLLLRHDPCREDAHRLVMRILVHRGERAEALRQFRVCEYLLRREFDAVPEALTSELFEQIRNGSSLT
jgi:DNA-binding SARP family transcriptional activator